MNQDQLDYLENVLGLKAVVFPTTDGFTAEPRSEGDTRSALLTSAPTSRVDVRVRGRLSDAKLIAIWARTDRSGEAEILAEKMISAIKLKSTDVLWLEWMSEELRAGESLPPQIEDVLRESGSRPVLIFGAEAAKAVLFLNQVQYGSWIDYRSARYLVTLSPEELLVSHDKKKAAWAHLQLLMRAL